MRIPITLAALYLSFASGCATDFPDAVDAGGGGGDDDGGGDGTGPTVLPFAVDDWYGPSGYMGDGETPGAIVDEMTCHEERPNTWLGRCHRYLWTPGDRLWAGVYWQYPDGNWGDLPGLDLPAGASRVSFRAWGAAGGEVVSFMAGMMAVDGFEVSAMDVALTTEPQAYTIELGEAAYGKVVGGFGWVARDSATPVRFSIDDIRWE
jgi:hypothetical protein